MANRFTAALLSSLLALAAASPAMVWNKSSSKMTENRYISEKIPASKLISEASLAEDSNGLSLVFVVYVLRHLTGRRARLHKQHLAW